MSAGLVRVVVALLPLVFVPVLAHLIAGGQIDIGGGEKDLMWVVSWLLWSLLFGTSSFVLWHFGWPVWQSTFWSAIVALVGVLVAAAILTVFGQLGVAARF